MPHRTEKFINNNLCAIHDKMRSQLQLAEDAIIEKQDEEALIHVETALRLLEAAIVKSIKIEDRLKLYRFTIRGLGFERNKEFEELEFRGENLILKEKTLIDAMHQRKFREIWDRGNYRLGSTALRMVPMIIDKIPDGATINDYGSGTGRAEIELLKYRAYKINMIDIAENALEEEAKIIIDRPDSPLKMFIADLSDLSGLPYAEWGICINVLMTVQPEKLDKILSEIRRTCGNLIFEAYDFVDMRLDEDRTSVKKNADEWASKLLEHWAVVEFEKSPESARRYIYICKS